MSNKISIPTISPDINAERIKILRESLHAAGGATFYRVTDAERDQAFNVCLDDTLSLETVRALALGPEDLFICRDAANLALQCRWRRSERNSKVDQ
jgi:hypothetical protein